MADPTTVIAARFAYARLVFIDTTIDTGSGRPPVVACDHEPGAQRSPVHGLVGLGDDLGLSRWRLSGGMPSARWQRGDEEERDEEG
jgi:hypothetical protein